MTKSSPQSPLTRGSQERPCNRADLLHVQEWRAAFHPIGSATRTLRRMRVHFSAPTSGAISFCKATAKLSVKNTAPGSGKADRPRRYRNIVRVWRADIVRAGTAE